MPSIRLLVQVLKGKLPETFDLYGSETFICAHCKLSKGRYLAFLTKDDKLWTGTNWQLSLRPIKGEQVEWYAEAGTPHQLTYQSLEAVLKQLRPKKGRT